MNSKLKNSYEPFYWSTLGEFNLTMAEGCLIFLIRGLSKNTGYCYASKHKLAEILNTTETTIYSLIKKLIIKGMIKRRGLSEYRTMCLSTVEKFDSYVESLKRNY